MILSTMVYLTVVSVAAALAALAAHDGLRRLEIPTRFVWLASLALGPALLLGGWLLGLRASVPQVSSPVFRIPIALPELILDRNGTVWRSWIENGIALAWLAGCAAVALLLLRGQLVLIREKRSA